MVVNLQGDEPLIDPAALDLLAGLLADDPAADMATLAVPIRDRATYTTRTASRWSATTAAGPCTSAAARSRTSATASRTSPPTRRGSCSTSASTPTAATSCCELAALPPHPLEQLEKLEQLRVLGAGGTIHVGVVAHADRGVDTPADYDAFVRAYRRARPCRAA